jgi:hypothetical protein
LDGAGREEATTLKNCGHEGCKCQVADDQEFCSDHCREHVASGPTGEPCGCGHAECTAA